MRKDKRRKRSKEMVTDPLSAQAKNPVAEMARSEAQSEAKEVEEDDLLPEYHFDYSKGVRGKYYDKLVKYRPVVVVLDSDVAEAFKDSATVNKVLRALIPIVNLPRPAKKKKTTRPSAHTAARRSS
jgi:hypothetical protein